tara:strand:+ start:497 stop:1219 length:723 start_codon:yes stop_codon:yes gene_type:complete
MQLSSSTAIEIDSLTKTYGNHDVLENLSMVVNWGDVVSIFGPNGSGKTTLIRILATLSSPSSGKIHISGLDSQEYSHYLRRSIGVLTHDSMLYSHLTGLENLRFYGGLFHVANPERRITEIAESLNLSSFLNKRVDTMSHGMRRRISLARSILHDPPILLLDEPDAGIDQVALDILGSITVSSKGKRTVLMTTHNIEIGFSLSNRIAIISGGKIAYTEGSASKNIDQFKDIYKSFTRVSN